MSPVHGGAKHARRSDGRQKPFREQQIEGVTEGRQSGREDSAPRHNAGGQGGSSTTSSTIAKKMSTAGPVT